MTSSTSTRCACNLGTNVVVRNNLLVGKYRMTDGQITKDGRCRYGSGFTLHSVPPDTARRT